MAAHGVGGVDLSAVQTIGGTTMEITQIERYLKTARRAVFGVLHVMARHRKHTRNMGPALAYVTVNFLQVRVGCRAVRARRAPEGLARARRAADGQRRPAPPALPPVRRFHAHTRS
jgi:hypothetical protein